LPSKGRDEAAAPKVRTFAELFLPGIVERRASRNPVAIAQRSTSMAKTFAMVCVLLALVVFVGTGDAGAQKKNQMVKGTIKVVDTDKNVLIVNQKVKNEVVDRELSILESTEFVIMKDGAKQELTGAQGLKALEGSVGAPVQVKCDKDVNVLKVTVTIKK
jgi:hypothetical protein